MATPRPMRVTTLSVYCAMSRWCERASTTATPADHRQPSDHEGQERGDQRAEHREQHEQRERERDELGAQQVVLQLGVEVGEERWLAGEGDREGAVAEGGLHRRKGAHRRLLVALQPHQHQGGPAVPGDESVAGLLGCGDHRDHPLHVGKGADLLQNLEEAAAWNTGSTAGSVRWVKRATRVVSSSAPAHRAPAPAARVASVPSIVPLVNVPPRISARAASASTARVPARTAGRFRETTRARATNMQGTCSARSSPRRQPTGLPSAPMIAVSDRRATSRAAAGRRPPPG